MRGAARNSPWRPGPKHMLAVFAATIALAGALGGDAAHAATLGTNPEKACAALSGELPPSVIGATSGPAVIDSATIVGAQSFAVADKAPNPAARITPATPSFCKVSGHIKPVDTNAPNIHFQVNLPLDWNGRSVQYGGGGFNGVLVTGLGLPPALPFDKPSPLAQDFVTYGTDSGHQAKPGEEPPAFAANDEAFANFAHLSYKKVRDVAAFIVKRAYGKHPSKLYFVGSSEGGREGLTMAQRYPSDFHGIFSRVPVINWVGLQHAGWNSGLAIMGEGYLSLAHVKLVHQTVTATCDGQDGLADDIVSNPMVCQKKFDVKKLACPANQSGEHCLTPAQIKAVQTLHTSFKLPTPVANGLDDYPGWGISGEATPGFGSAGGWSSWWLGTTAPSQPPVPSNGIAWRFGSGAVRHIFMRKPDADVTSYEPTRHLDRIREVSALMDSTNPDLSAFAGRGGKLIILEYMADYAQSPYAGIRYFQAVERKMGAARVRRFLRLYTAPGVDHVGSGAPANVDMLSVLVDWVERGKAPGHLQVVEQSLEATPRILRARPLCQWPKWPKYQRGEPNDAKSFACVN